jgi:hypothetical protein
VWFAILLDEEVTEWREHDRSANPRNNPS